MNVILFSLIGCGPPPDRDHDGVLDAEDKCPDVAAKTTDGCPVKAIGHVHLFLDNSASMAGYFQQDAEYKTIVSDVVAKTDKLIKPIDIWFISDTLNKYNHPSDQFSSDIATTRIADRKSSEMHEMFREIVQKTDSTDISLFVSDCILSFPDSAVKANPEINRTEAPNALKENIFSTFSDIKKKGWAASVYAFRSKFYGTYYDYQNDKMPLSGAYRPFYIWVIGQRDVLLRFEAQLEDISTFKPLASLHFGFLNNPITQYKVMPQIERQGAWMVSDDGIRDVVSNGTGHAQVCLMVNLADLPAYAQRQDYLASNLKVSCNGCSITATVKIKTELDRSKLKNQNQLRAFEINTHGILLNISGMTLNVASVNLTLPLKYDSWYQNWSTSDDRELGSQENKTFALANLIDGVKEAFEMPGKNFIDISIKIGK